MQPLTLTLYSDSDFGGKKKTLKSRSGWTGCVYGFIFFWNSRKRTSTALSAPEDEYIDTCEACSDLKWLQTLTSRARFHYWSINTAILWKNCFEWLCWKWTQIYVLSMKRAWNIDLKYNFGKDCTNTGIMKPLDINSEGNPAIVFNEPPEKTMFDNFWDAFCVRLWKKITLRKQDGWYPMQ